MFFSLLLTSISAVLLPDQFNWYLSNPSIFDPVSSQNQPHYCLSSYAIQVAAMLSARLRIANPSWAWQVDASPQELLCDEVNLGCMGGDSYNALIYTEQYGLPISSELPYMATGWTNSDKCHKKSQSNRVFAKQLKLLESESAIQTDMMNNGPLVCGLYKASLFLNYSSGIIDDGESSKMINHDVLLVGWGVTAEGQKYWIGVNSYGQGWGESGLFKIERGHNTLGIESYCISGKADMTFRHYDYKLKINLFPLTPIKNQYSIANNCETGWAFAGLSTIADRIRLITQYNLDLSQQELLNCGVGSCRTGDASMVLAFAKTRPLMPQSCQHFIGKPSSSATCQSSQLCRKCNPPLIETPQNPNLVENCSSSTVPHRFSISSYHKLQTVESIKKELLKGPVVCGIEATEGFRNYAGGMLEGQPSNPTNYNHSVSIVGLGVQEIGGGEYWLIRNSYGLGWGENGFFRTPVGDNTLGLEKYCFGATINI